jgi:hypothetical protein
VQFIASYCTAGAASGDIVTSSLCGMLPAAVLDGSPCCLFIEALSMDDGLAKIKASNQLAAHPRRCLYHKLSPAGQHPWIYQIAVHKA